MPTRRPRTTITALSGQSLKPLGVTSTGVVLFSQDGTNLAPADQTTCERYGYFYDTASAVCRAFKPSLVLESNSLTENNTIRGGDNTINSGVVNNIVNGYGNTLTGLNRSDVTIGIDNTVVSGINNSLTLGELTNTTTSNSIVIGGNTNGDLLGERQSIQCIYGCQTTGTANVSSGINNVSGVRFAIPDNCIIYFHADTIAVRTAGSSGTGSVGDYASYVERGVIINKSGTATIQRERDTIKTQGTVTNWRILASVGAGNTLALQCRSNTNQTIEWCMNVTITQITTNVSL